MTKPTINPSHHFARLEAVTTTASSALARAERDLAWYRSAMMQKNLWARGLELDLERAKQQVFWWKVAALLATLACATALASRWL